MVVEIGEENLRRGHLTTALSKARWRIIPLLSICYLAAFMDRANISFAAESMNRDLHFSPKVYALGAGLFFVSYALLEIPSNRLLLRFGARRWLARIMLTWGALAAAMMFVHSARSFYGMRLLLGAAEAGYFPGVVYYLSQWFPPAYRARAIAWFYTAFPLSNLVMGGLAGALLRLNGRMGLAGWQWLFLLEGLPAVVLSVVVWFALPDGPRSAKWLSVDEARVLEAEVAAGLPSHEKEIGAIGKVLSDGCVWVYGLFYFLTLGTFYAVNFFLPLMLRGLTGWTPERVGFLIAGTGIVSATAMVLNGRHSDKRRERLWHIVLPLAVMTAMLVVASVHMAGLVAAVALMVFMVGYSAMQGPVWAGATRVMPGALAAIAIATVNTCGNTGGFVGPYFTGWMKEHTGGYAVGVGLLGVPLVLAAVAWPGLCGGCRLSRP